MYVVAYYTVFAMRKMNLQWSIAKNKTPDLVLLFYIAMYDLTIYLSILFDLHVLRLTCIDINKYTRQK